MNFKLQKGGEVKIIPVTKETKELEIRFLKQDNEILRKELKDKQHQLNSLLGISVLLLIFVILLSFKNMGVI